MSQFMAQTGCWRLGRACLLCPGISGINLFRYCQGIVHFDALTGLFAQLESDRPAGFLLSDSSAIRRVSAGSDILDPDGDDITATQLAVDRQVEHGEVASAAFDLKFRPDRPDVFGRNGGFAPVTFWRPDLLWAKFHRPISARRRLCRPHP